MMKAVILERRGPDGVRIGTFPDPVPEAGDAIVRMRAASLNHADLYMRDSGAGITHELPMILGLDGAGEVVEAPPGSSLKPGDRVMTYTMEFCGTCEWCQAGEQPFCERLSILGETRHGTYCEYLRIRASSLLPVPEGLSWEEAAALPVGHLTAWRMVFGKIRPCPGETMLIMGVGGGVALAALQLALLAGLRVIVTSSGEEKRRKALAMGAVAAIDYRHESVHERVRMLTGGRGADIVIDNVGKESWPESLRSARKGGTILCCGTTTGGHPSADLQRVFVRQLRIQGSTLANMAECRDLIQAVSHHGLRPIIDSVVPFDQAIKAMARMEQGAQFGKIVLRMP